MIKGVVVYVRGASHTFVVVNRSITYILTYMLYMQILYVLYDAL